MTVSIGGCGSSSGSDAQTADGCISHFDANTDYFPAKSTLTDAQNFTLEYHNSYQVLTVKQPFPGGRPESYVLVKCGAPKPALTGDLASAEVINTPVRSLDSGSTTHIPLITALGETGVLRGVANGKVINDGEVASHVQRGTITEYASGGTINVEKVVAAKPDVLVTDGTDLPDYAQLRKAGVNIVADAEWLETTPLGRAEWIKMMAALTGKETQAAQLYGKIRTDYEAVAAKAKGVPPVQVLPGTMYQGTWCMPAGGGYAGQLLRDAGATYPWQHDPSTGSLKLNFESVFAQDGTAPIWLVDSPWPTIADGIKASPQYAELAAAKSGQVWASTKVLNAGGGSDYYESGVLRPDLVLGDLLAIVHPDLEPGHQFAYYKQLARG